MVSSMPCFALVFYLRMIKGGFEGPYGGETLIFTLLSVEYYATMARFLEGLRRTSTD